MIMSPMHGPAQRLNARKFIYPDWVSHLSRMGKVRRRPPKKNVTLTENMSSAMVALYRAYMWVPPTGGGVVVRDCAARCN